MGSYRKQKIDRFPIHPSIDSAEKIQALIQIYNKGTIEEVMEAFQLESHLAEEIVENRSWVTIVDPQYHSFEFETRAADNANILTVDDGWADEFGKFYDHKGLAWFLSLITLDVFFMFYMEEMSDDFDASPFWGYMVSPKEHMLLKEVKLVPTISL
jgi:hypothetical protein